MNDSTMQTVADTLTKPQQALQALKTEGLDHSQYDEALQILVQSGIEMAISITVKVVIAVIIYFLGRKLIKLVNNGVSNIMNRRDFEPSLKSFIGSFVNVVLMFVLLIAIISILGIETSSFVALFASAGVAIGMAVSGTLQNFAGGVLILLFKPYKIGDYIEAAGQAGTVKEIQIFNTIILTIDNKTIIVPNGSLSTGITINYSSQPKRRVDFVFGIGYGESYDKAKNVLMEIINADSRIDKDPAPFIALTKLNDSSVDLVVRVWTDTANYWGVYFDMNEKVYKAFTEKGINIPFPQMDVHLVK